MSPVHLSAAPAPTRTDQTADARLDFWRSAAALLAADPDRLDRIDPGLDPSSIIDLVLPVTSAEERSELLWALGEFERRHR